MTNNQNQPNFAVPMQGAEQKPKKKKKHRFLKFLLFNAALILLYLGIKWMCDRMALKELEKVASDMPFTFSDDSNAKWYVTADFSVPVTYTDTEGKEYQVTWSSSNTNIIQIDEDGNAEVKRPGDAGRTVIVTQTYKKLLGKAQISYELYVAAEGMLSVESVDVVTLEELRQQTYNRDMRAILDENGALDYMIGDFKNTNVYSKDDAFVVLQAYRGEFGTPENYEFVFEKVVDTTDLINYIFIVTYDGHRVENASANVTALKETGEVRKIAISTGAAIENLPTAGAELDFNTIITEYVKANDPDNGAYELIIMEKEDIISQGRLIKVFHVIFENGAYFVVHIDAATGEVIKYATDATTFWESTSQTAKGKTELGEEVTINVCKNPVGTVFMFDLERNIHVFDNYGWFGLYREVEEKEDPGIMEMLGGLLDYYISNGMNAEIIVKNDYADNAVAVQSQYHIQRAYDWYKDTFSLTSYDGKGAPIVIITDIATTKDNASWVGSEQTFRVNIPGRLEYTTSCSDEVMAHEYTHAVFSYKLSGTFDNSTAELAGINEAYADIFGCLATDSTDWIVGKNVLAETGEDICFRDIANINDGSIRLWADAVYPETYMDENWTGECHNISVLISHVAYEMWASDLFSEEELANIWYNSLGYGYTAESTFLTTREYVLNAAQDLNCSKEQIDFIEKAFAGVGIGTYEGEEDVVETESNAVEGDIILDDTETNRYIIFYSTIGTLFGESGIYIWQESNGASDEEIEATSKRLTEMINEKYPDVTWTGRDIEVEYKQVNKVAMDILIDFCSDSEVYLKDITYQALDATPETAGESTNALVQLIMDLGFYWDIREGTAYDIYDSLGFLE